MTAKGKVIVEKEDDGINDYIGVTIKLPVFACKLLSPNQYIQLADETELKKAVLHDMRQKIKIEYMKMVDELFDKEIYGACR